MVSSTPRPARRFEVARMAAAALHGERQVAWLDLLEASYDDLAAALSAALEAGRGVDALRLATDLAYFLFLRGRAPQGHRWLERCLDAAADAPPELRAEALVRLGLLLMEHADERADAPLTEGLELYRSLEDDAGVAQALWELGVLAWWRDDLEGAAAALSESAELARRAGADRVLWGSVHELAGVTKEKGDRAAARALYEEALSHSRRTGNLAGLYSGLCALAGLAADEGDLERAGPLAEEGLDLAERLANPRFVAAARLLLARIQRLETRLDRATPLAEAVLAEVRAWRSTQWTADALVEVGECALANGDTPRAREAFREALDAWRAEERSASPLRMRTINQGIERCQAALALVSRRER